MLCNVIPPLPTLRSRSDPFILFWRASLPRPAPWVVATRSVAEPSPQVCRIKPPRPTVSQAPQPACFQLPTVDKLGRQATSFLPSRKLHRQFLDISNATQLRGRPHTRTHNADRYQ